MTTKNIKIIGLIFLLLTIFACKKEDNVKPLVAIKGLDTLRVVLNSKFTDPGVTATDETDGDLSQNVAIISELNMDKVDFYTIYYSVSDKAGNISETISRVVEVYNEAETFIGNWVGFDTTLYFGKSKANEFNLSIYIDSAVNNNIVLSTISSDKVGEVTCEIDKTNIEIQEQKITYNDSLKVICQGRGTIKDSVMRIHYAYYTDTTAEFKYVKINREKF